jgi:hypothetical protein
MSDEKSQSSAEQQENEEVVAHTVLDLQKIQTTRPSGHGDPAWSCSSCIAASC